MIYNLGKAGWSKEDDLCRMNVCSYAKQCNDRCLVRGRVTYVLLPLECFRGERVSRKRKKRKKKRQGKRDDSTASVYERQPNAI